MEEENLERYLQERRARTEQRLTAFSRALREDFREGESAELLGDHTCLYAVGSAGRGEMSDHSDLDVFLVREGQPTRTDEVRLQSAIVRALRTLRIKPPSRDAYFLKLHSADSLVERLGAPTDDAENTFTVRMLLLLESKPIENRPVYDRLLQHSLEAYWKNSEQHREDYQPIVLLNDIVRYWRNVLLNYESRTEETRRSLLQQKRLRGETPAFSQEEKLDFDAERWLRSYKLRFSRCLTCYSAIGYLLAQAANTTRAGGRRSHVSRSTVLDMVLMPPLERLRSIPAIAPARDTQGLVATLRRLYVDYLAATDVPKADLIARMRVESSRRELVRPAFEFGDTMFALIHRLGEENPLYRYLIV